MHGVPLPAPSAPLPFAERGRGVSPATARRPTARPDALLLTENEGLCRTHYALLNSLDPAAQAEVLALGVRKTVGRGGSVFTQGNPHQGVFIIESGRIRVFYSAPSGREITLGYWGAGHFVGGPNLFGEHPHLWSGVAVASSRLIFLEGRVLRRLVAQMPDLAIGLIESLSFKGRCYSAMAQMLGTRSVSERLAHLLLHLSETQGVPHAEGLLIADSYTHAELAHLVGASRQWVTISLKKLQERGIVDCRNATIIVCRPDLLAELRG